MTYLKFNQTLLSFFQYIRILYLEFVNVFFSSLQKNETKNRSANIILSNPLRPKLKAPCFLQEKLLIAQ